MENTVTVIVHETDNSKLKYNILSSELKKVACSYGYKKKTQVHVRQRTHSPQSGEFHNSGFDDIGAQRSRINELNSHGVINRLCESVVVVLHK